jgi:hypothetical protein
VSVIKETIMTEKLRDLELDLHPDFDGESVERYMGFKELGFRLVISAARPRDEAEMKRFYNMDLETFYGKAVKQCMYDADGDLKALIASGAVKVAVGNELALAKAYAQALATKEVKKERTQSPEAKAKAQAKRAEVKAKVTAANDLEAKTGVTVAEMAAMTPAQLMALAKEMAKAEKNGH